MSKYRLLAIKRHDLESGGRATGAELLSKKSAGTSRQIIYNSLDQCRLAAAGTTGEQNFFGDNARLWHRLPYS